MKKFENNRATKYRVLKKIYGLTQEYMSDREYMFRLLELSFKLIDKSSCKKKQNERTRI